MHKIVSQPVLREIELKWIDREKESKEDIGLL